MPCQTQRPTHRASSFRRIPSETLDTMQCVQLLLPRCGTQRSERRADTGALWRRRPLFMDGVFTVFQTQPGRTHPTTTPPPFTAHGCFVTAILSHQSAVATRLLYRAYSYATSGYSRFIIGRSTSSETSSPLRPSVAAPASRMDVEPRRRPSSGDAMGEQLSLVRELRTASSIKT